MARRGRSRLTARTVLTALSALSVVALLLATLLLVGAGPLRPISGKPVADADAVRSVPAQPSTTTPTDAGPVVTVPPLTTAAPAPAPSPVEATPDPAPASTNAPLPDPPPSPEAAPAPSPEAPASPASVAPEPVAPEPVPPTEPTPTPGLPELVAPYDRVQGEHGADSGRVAYLTFDDGPGPHTPAVLDILDAAGVRATFCQVGNQIDGHPDTERRLIAAGHTLCNHSWSHPTRLDTAGAPAIADEMTRTQDALARFGVTSRYFRAPGGSFGPDDPTLRQVAQANDLIPLGWAVDSQDWRKPGVQQIVDTVLTTVRPGAVILLHDAGGADRDQTLAALPMIISGLRAAGYDLQPLPPGGF
ncbi:polysaccharide deacetylase family protein [Nakamurella flavida]|uniref:Polysaccharide deacetylase family protein n=1 Tax=Nakamurella flavida TaxID=363630 RepID=A0A939C3Y6_9ACTN|nr:polysaccharide deacetylase family protein [Nakamurella flavida]MBM9478170.1 polysaccharide deacetylase family protein [Nakamurella flavida]MDP9778608.1 peptidoglycan/xylan/chitin deacetylase (PgdA/CDA1 family) [Nakamurella flavida]